MCQICGLLDKSFPSPKSLAVALYEGDPSSKHAEEIVNKAMENMSEDEQRLFTVELMLEMLRTS